MLASLLAACLTQENFLETYMGAVCDRAFECRDEEEDLDEELDDEGWDDPGECADDQMDSLEDAASEGALDCLADPEVCAFDTEKAHDCIAAVNDVDCDEFVEAGFVEDCDLEDIYDCDEDALADCLGTGGEDTGGGDTPD
jgi:hypothetical protein